MLIVGFFCLTVHAKNACYGQFWISDSFYNWAIIGEANFEGSFTWMLCVIFLVTQMIINEFIHYLINIPNIYTRNFSM